VIVEATSRATQLIEQHVGRRNKEIDALRRESARLAERLKALLENDVTVKVDVKHQEPFTIKSPVPPSAPRRASRPTNDAVYDPDRPLKAERKPLAALASVYPAGMTEAQWAVAAGLKRTGGTWGTYVSRLRMAGRIAEQGDMFFATEQGIADLGGDIPQLPPPGPALVEFWAGKITGASKMLRYIAEQYPNFITRDDLGAALDLATGGGTFGTYLSRLRKPGLIEEQGDQLRAAPQLMEAA
jgi:uncharacterized protein